MGARPKGAASFVVIHNIIGGGCGDFKVARDSAQLCGGLFFAGLVFAAAHRCAAQLATYASKTPSPGNREYTSSFTARLSGWEIFILVRPGWGSF